MQFCGDLDYRQRHAEGGDVRHDTFENHAGLEILEELAQPERIAAIRIEHERRVARMMAKKKLDPLRGEVEPLDMDELYGQAKVCLACHK